MLQTTFDKQLSLLESQLHELTASLLEGSPATLQDASAKLQHLTVELLRMAKDTKRVALREPMDMRRVVALSNGMASFRENLLRRSAYIDSALGVLIPESKNKSTYTGSSVYGSSARRSGSFNAFSA